jgi:hypothetical protein
MYNPDKEGIVKEKMNIIATGKEPLLSIILVIILVPLLTATACRKKNEPNTVEFEQIETDGSVDDRYQFREEIQKQRERDRRYHRESF